MIANYLMINKLMINSDYNDCLSLTAVKHSSNNCFFSYRNKADLSLNKAVHNIFVIEMFAEVQFSRLVEHGQNFTY